MKRNIKGFHVGEFNKYDFKNLFFPPDHIPDVKIFHDQYFPETSLPNSRPYKPNWFFIYEKAVILIVDGIPFSDNFEGFMNFIKSNNAEDIKGIELSNNWKYTSKYKTRFIPPGAELEFDPIKIDFVFYRDYYPLW